MYVQMFLGFMISVAAAILGVLIGSLIWQFIRKPRLKIIPTWKIKGKTEPHIPRHFTPRRAFYHISVINHKMSEPARNVRLRLRWFKDGKEVLCIPGKWDFRPEPRRYLLRGGRLVSVPEPALIPQCEVININPCDKQSFCILMKEDGVSKAYAFNGFSYLAPDLKHPDYRLDPGEYIVRVELVGENVYTSKEFIIEIRGRGLDIGKDVVIEEKN